MSGAAGLVSLVMLVASSCVVMPSAGVHEAPQGRGWRPPKRQGLQGFQPTSLSFVDSDTGYLLGYAVTAGAGNTRLDPQTMVARTDDGGHTWRRMPAPRAAALGNDGSSTVTFLTKNVGVIYARRAFVTTDGAEHWRRTDRRHRMVDLEYGAGRIWALAHPCGDCHTLRLYSATVDRPHLRLVRGGPRFHHGGARFIHGGGDELYVVKTSKERRGRIFRSYRGGAWTKQREPCKSFGVFAASSEAGVAAVCNVVLLGVGNETKRAYASSDGAHSWTRRGAPGEAGYIGGLAAGTSDNWVLADARTAFDTTTDEGGHWTYAGPRVDLAGGAGVTQFTSATQVVAIPEYMPDRIFMYSDDAGLQWSITRFPK